MKHIHERVPLQTVANYITITSMSIALAEAVYRNYNLIKANHDKAKRARNGIGFTSR